VESPQCRGTASEHHVGGVTPSFNSCTPAIARADTCEKGTGALD
jgi:hypothetical protein